MRPFYKQDDRYDQLVDALAHAGRIDRNEIMMILGEIGNIWPQSVLRETLQCATADILPLAKA